MDGSFRDTWIEAKARHKELLKQVPLITENEIVIESKIKGGEDASSIMYRSLWQGRTVAVKKWKIVAGKDKTLEQFTKACADVDLIVSKHNPCIAKALGISESGAVVLEWVPTSLMTWCQQQSKCDYDLKLKVLYQAASALAHLHTAPIQIMHCDVTPNSFFVSGDDEGNNIHIKVWGFRHLAVRTADMKEKMMMQPTLQTVYSAPKLCRGEPDTLKSDVFSFGVVMCEVATQRAPYGGAMNTENVVCNMKNAQIMPCTIPDVFPNEFHELVCNCLSVSPARRPSMRNVQVRLKEILQI